MLITGGCTYIIKDCSKFVLAYKRLIPSELLLKMHAVQIATYFTFLGMYTRWMLFPASLGLTVQLVDFG